jgi:Uma2 family endonuclease
MPVTEATYERLALEDDEGKWELVCGRPRQKPPMTTEHDDTARRLVRRLNFQLDEAEYSVGQESPNLRVPGGNYRIPDVCVVPRVLVVRRKAEFPTRLEVYDEPMPLVIEIWSPSTGDVDGTEKLREYQERGDLEIWQIHPIDRTLTAWRRQRDGGYAMALYTGGIVPVASLPGVAIDLDSLFR